MTAGQKTYIRVAFDHCNSFGSEGTSVGIEVADLINSFNAGERKQATRIGFKAFDTGRMDTGDPRTVVHDLGVRHAMLEGDHVAVRNGGGGGVNVLRKGSMDDIGREKSSNEQERAFEELHNEICADKLDSQEIE